MTVKELIDALERMPMDSLVIKEYGGGQFVEIDSIFKTEEHPSFDYDGYSNCVVLD